MKSNETYAIDIQGLEKTYKTGVKALNSVDLKVEKGDFFALLGPNGAGKSTVIGILSSLITKSKGKVKIFGIEHERRSFDRDRDHDLGRRSNDRVPIGDNPS